VLVCCKNVFQLSSTQIFFLTAYYTCIFDICKHLIKKNQKKIKKNEAEMTASKKRQANAPRQSHQSAFRNSARQRPSLHQGQLLSSAAP
jgi:hypothetical protein